MIKSKPCTVDGCSQPRFAKGLCKKHQSLRTDGKAPKPLKKIKENSKAQAKKELKKALWPTDMAFYLKVWMSRPHFCYSCGMALGLKPATYNFDHILEKGNKKYEHLRHVEENICLLCWDCHTNKSLIPVLTRLREETKKLLCGKDTQKEILKQDDLSPLEGD